MATAKQTKGSTVTRMTHLDRDRYNDLTPYENLPAYQYEGVTPPRTASPPVARKPDPNMVAAAVKRGAIRKD